MTYCSNPECPVEDCEEHPGLCEKPPKGWRCTRYAGHEGPCAAISDDPWAALRESDQAYVDGVRSGEPELKRLRAENESLRELLAELEWNGAVEEFIHVCPCCENRPDGWDEEKQPTGGHEPDCALAAALSGAVK